MDEKEIKKLLFEKQESIDELSFLNRILVSAQKTESLDKICEIIAKEVSGFYPDTIVAVSLYDNDFGGVRIRAIEGVGKKYQQFAKMLGKDPRKMVFDAKQLDKTYEHYTSGSLIQVEGGLSELMKGQLPEFVCRNAEKLMAVSSVYTVGFKDSDMAKGGIVMFMRHNKPLLNPRPIETALSFVSELLKRMLAEEEHRKSDERFRIAQDMSPDGFTILQPIRNKQGHVIDFNWIYENETIAKLNGTNTKDVVGGSLLELFPGHKGTTFFNAYKQVAESGKSIAFEEGYGGETMKKATWFRIVVVPMNKNIAILAQDITDRKLVEEELQSANQQLQASEQQLIASNKQLVANEQQLLSKEKELQIKNHELSERLKEIGCLFRISRIINEYDDMDKVLHNSIKEMPSGWQYPQIMVPRIVFQGKNYESENFLETKWKQTADIITGGQKQGVIEVFYLEEKPLLDEGPFLEEERYLLNSIADILGKAIESILKTDSLQTTNQQLVAKEQQLRATNQQLTEMNQQLVASKQELLAGEKELRITNEKAQRNEKYYHTILNKMGDPVFVKDEQNRLLLVNDAFCDLFDLKKKDILGKSLAEDISTQKLDVFLSIDRDVIQFGKENVNEESLKLRDGRTQIISIKKTRFEDSNGTKFLIGNIRDVTESRSHERTTNAKNKISQIVLSKEEDEMYADVLDAALQIMESKYGVFGYINEEGDLVCPSMSKGIWEECKMMDKTVVFPKNTWGDSIWGKGLRNKKGAYSNKSFKVPQGHLPVERFLTIPLVYQNESIGLLSVGNKSTDYTDEDFNLLQEIADYLAPVIAVQQQRKKVLESLAESNIRFEKAQEMGKVGNYEYDIASKKYWFSDEGKRIYGYSLEINDFTADEIRKCIPDRERVQEAWVDLIEKDKSYNLEYEIRPVSGPSSKTIKTIGELVKDESGNPIKVVGFIQDITELKKAEEELMYQEMHLRSMMENPFGYVVYRTRLVRESGEIKVIQVSNSFSDVLGIPEEDIFNCQKWFNHVHPEDLPLITKANEDVKKPPFKFNVELRYNHPFDGLKWFEFRANGIPYQDDPSLIEYANGIIFDITHRKRVEEELKLAKEKAEESDQLKTVFLHNISHEIRTPMNGIVGFVNLLSKPNLNESEKEHYSQMIKQSSGRMLNTVNDIISISQIQVGETKVTDRIININEKIRQLYDFFKGEAESKNLRLAIDLPLKNEQSFIETDESKFESIVTNLIKNAIKYSDGGTIEFGYKVVDGYVRCYCRDQGIGVPADMQKAIFERFEQVDKERSRVFEGSGLGLSITKAYVEMLGGKIWVESVEGEGSVFYFTLPLTTTKKKQKTNKTKPISMVIKKQVRKLKILIAEDDDISIDYLKEILKGVAEKMYVAKTGKEAIEVFESHTDIDVILMDIEMPIFNGYEATKKIREFNKDVKIIAQTAYALPGDRKKALEAGCNDYISKPIDEDTLNELIK